MTNILSLCDGMSCGQIALRELGIKYDRYYASEIDKHCIRQTQLNFPDTIQLGDIENWREWDIDWASIRLILAGTPCTGFSFAGKQLAFDDPQSRLILSFLEILNHARKYNPDVLFLLENVRMKKEYLRIISENVGVHPVLINSALVSAQNRNRYYWSNIRTKRVGLFGEFHTDIPQSADRGIVLRDILENEVDGKYFLTAEQLDRILKKEPRINPRKSYCLMKSNRDCRRSVTLVLQLNPSTESQGTQPYQQDRVYDTNYKSPALIAEMSCGSYAILQRGHGFNKGGIKESKAPALTASDYPDSNFLLSEGSARRLTPTECARLQTVPAWYRWDCSNTQQYRMLGNGWTIEVIKHILSYLPKGFFNK
ncbi:MAG: DNA cytosine methyltransferase [Dysgonamonadaceae bacterium]|jgi:DNA (cytosine-5)-methyltransferase 3A|nr:DNA cytosine methyltransferase [Dysgonamonadaceae bacterium]